ncbi:MAG: amino acid permease [Caulobacteraceae bacterium]
MGDLFRRKSVDAQPPEGTARLKATLSWPHLVALGVGAIVGTGIYTLTGVGAGMAGPAVILSFVIAGLVCACAALAYAEMATMIPMAGSAYTYSYAVLGEILAWVVGWSLILEYTVVCSAVAVGWSGYLSGALEANHWGIPHALLAGPGSGGVINLPAVIISLAVAGLLSLGTRESARLNVVLVAIKIAALVAFVVIAAPAFHASHFKPFMPYGFVKHEAFGKAHGVMAAAAVIFFAFYGFDTISTAAEETKNPARDLKVGIVGSMVACTVIYMAVAATALGAVSYAALAGSPEPLALVLRSLNQPLAATLIALAAILALPTVILAFLFGQSRIFFVMSRDGMLPAIFSRVSARTGAPVLVTLATGVIVAVIAGLLPLEDIAALANAGTLCAFIAVSVCMLVMRVREPGRVRVFKAPLAWVLGPVAILGCLYLFTSLKLMTIALFFVWNAIGLGVYLVYARKRSRLA